MNVSAEKTKSTGNYDSMIYNTITYHKLISSSAQQNTSYFIPTNLKRDFTTQIKRTCCSSCPATTAATELLFNCNCCPFFCTCLPRLTALLSSSHFTHALLVLMAQEEANLCFAPPYAGTKPNILESFANYSSTVVSSLTKNSITSSSISSVSNESVSVSAKGRKQL